MTANPVTKTDHRTLAKLKEISISEAAELKSVSPLTIRRWIQQGKLRAYRYGPKTIRIRVADLEAMGEEVNPITFDYVNGGGRA